MKYSFKSIELLSISWKIKVGSKVEGIIVLGGLRKKYLTGCQILRSKDYLYSLIKSVLQYSEGLNQINIAPK